MDPKLPIEDEQMAEEAPTTPTKTSPGNEETGEVALTLMNLVDLKLGLEQGDIDALDDDALAEQIAKLLPKKVDAYIHTIDKLEAEAEIYGRMADAAAAAANAKKKSIERMRHIAKLAMEILDVDKLEGEMPRYGFSIHEGRETLHISSVEQLPYDCVKFTKVAKKDQIKQRLIAGQTVPGAVMMTGEAYLKVRRGK